MSLRDPALVETYAPAPLPLMQQLQSATLAEAIGMPIPTFADTIRLSESPFAPQVDAPPPAPQTAPDGEDTPQPPKASAGRIVHFVLSGEAESLGQHRPAIITQVNFDGTVSIHVWTHDADGGRYAHGHYFAHFIAQDETDKRPGTWHWPEHD